MRCFDCDLRDVYDPHSNFFGNFRRLTYLADSYRLNRLILPGMSISILKNQRSGTWFSNPALGGWFSKETLGGWFSKEALGAWLR